MSAIGRASTHRDEPESTRLEVLSLGSGSCGNALLLRTPEMTLLIDCGVGIRRLSHALLARGLTPRDIDAVLISHEHSDHVRELPRFQALRTPILSTRGSALAASVDRESWIETRPEQPLAIANAEIVSIPVSHDAAEPCGFLIRTSAGSVTVLTDLGCIAGPAAEAVSESSLVVLEANHDEALLRRGPYPAHLQRRILSDSGHLSNLACAELLARALGGARRLPTVWLAHLSETNNRPSLARQTVLGRLRAAGITIDVIALPRRDVSAVWKPERARAGVAQLALGFPGI
jgi:phosphoribosyl 1,2-cyclic phosphodiesterase